jgi:dolichyl-phosphate-mannose-protein mannosyltransferase
MTAAWKAVLVVGAITLVAGGLRLYRLGEPERKYFDEVYYAADGCLYAGRPYRECGLEEDAERSWVHPPLGKWAIAGGVAAFGNRSFGWRVPAAIAGTLTVALVGALAFLLFGRALWAGVAALLAAVEHLSFVQSRIAMLDIFLAMFVVLGFTLLVADRRRNDVALPGPAHEPPEAEVRAIRLGGLRPLRLAAGVALGAAVATKWSGVFALAGGLLLSILWAVTSLRRRGAGGGDVAMEAVGLVGAFALLPAAVYVVTWIPWLADHGWSLGQLLSHHGDMADYHLTLETVNDRGEVIHPYLSRAWTWLLLLRPVAYFWQGDPDCCAEILGIGHPLVFWGALVVLPYLAWTWWARRDWRAGATLIPILAQYLPWLLVSRPLFLFYMTPVAPFLALGLAFGLRDLVGSGTRGRRAAAVAAAAVVVASLLVFAFFFPVLTGGELTYQAWHHRIWMERWI